MIMAVLKRKLRKTLEFINNRIHLTYKFLCLILTSTLKRFKSKSKSSFLLSLVGLYLILSSGLDGDYESADLYRNQVSSMDYFYSVNETFFTDLRRDRLTIKLAFVVCSTRLSEAVTMLKTAIFFSREAHVNLYLIAIADLKNEIPLSRKLKELTEVALELDIQVNYEIHRIWLPSMRNKKYWVEMFAPCSSQRLFFPIALPHIDHLMYVDTDVLFLSNITDLWNEFNNMKSSHIAAVAAEHELPGDGWYNCRSIIPYYKPRGLNAGIMLMNLTAMRSFDFVDKIEVIFRQYGSIIKWADQDLLNILFHFYPQFLYELDCKYNYRVQHCDCDFPDSGDCGCKSAEKNGISIFHGNRQKFHNFFFTKAPSFIKNIYDAFSKYDLKSDSPEDLLTQMMQEYYFLTFDDNAPCRNITDALFTKFEQFTKKAANRKRRKIQKSSLQDTFNSYLHHIEFLL